MSREASAPATLINPSRIEVPRNTRYIDVRENGATHDRIERDLTSGALLVLLLGHVRHGPIHGYALIKAMEETTGGAHWKEGTIYPLLTRLEKEGLLRAQWQHGTGGPPRKAYALTPAGHRALDHARLTWSHLRDALDRLLEMPV